MKKRLLPLLVIVLAAATLFFGYKFLLAPETAEGEKFVTLHIIAEEQNINETFEFDTDSELLFDLLKEKADEISLVYEEYDFGPMVTGLMGYEANSNNQEYYHLLVNDEDAMTGPIEIPVIDGDQYVFELRTW